MFVDFNYYQNRYGGSKLSEDDFLIAERKSERFIDSLIGNMILNDRIVVYPAKIIHILKDCICENAEYLVDNEDDRTLSSYSINGVSMSFDNSNYSKEVKASIYQELISLGLISRVIS